MAMTVCVLTVYLRMHRGQTTVWLRTVRACLYRRRPGEEDASGASCDKRRFERLHGFLNGWCGCTRRRCLNCLHDKPNFAHKMPNERKPDTAMSDYGY